MFGFDDAIIGAVAGDIFGDVLGDVFSDDDPIRPTPVPGSAGASPFLPSVDDYSGGYGNPHPSGPSNFDDFASYSGPMPSSAFGIDDFLKGVKDFGSAAAPYAPWLSSALGYMGASDTNAQMKELAEGANTFNASQAQLNRDFNASEALKNRDFTSGQADKAMSFSERMSNTQWQRTVADMMQAGLNPMLAYSKGVNSSPSGVAGSGSAASSGGMASAVVPQVSNKLAAGMSSARDTSEVFAKVNELEMRAKHEDALERVARAAADELMSRVNLQSGQTNRISTEIGKLVSEIAVNKEEVERIKAEVLLIVSREKNLSGVERDHISAQVAQLDMHLPGQFAQSKADMTSYGQNVRPFLGDAGKVISSAGDVFGMGRDAAIAKRLFNRGSGR